MLKKYLFNILISLDQLANTILGGSPDETISSRLERNYDDSWMEKSVNWLFRWQGGEHCDKSLEPEDRSKDSIIK